MSKSHSHFSNLQAIMVTGTNGKSTTTELIASIVGVSEPNAKMTTLAAQVQNRLIPAHQHQFAQILEESCRVGVKTIAIETTSKSLQGGFASRYRPTVGVFTNLTHDHISFHKNFENYRLAKSQLFRNILGGGCAVLNKDDPSYEYMLSVVPQDCTTLTYSTRDAQADLTAQSIEVSTQGTRIIFCPSVVSQHFGGVLYTQSVGVVHAENSMAAALATYALGYSGSCIQEGINQSKPLKGRFEIVHQSPLVVIDYAHTPDGFASSIHTSLHLKSPNGRLLVVFGCGGNRDIQKRSEIGAIVGKSADFVCLCNDNPRYEDPQKIISDICSQITTPKGHWVRVFDRRKAIWLTLAQATPQDVVLIAGKGHESYQEIKGKKIPSSDHAFVAEYIKKIRYKWRH